MITYYVRYKIQGEEYCKSFYDLVKATLFAKKYKGVVEELETV